MDRPSVIYCLSNMLTVDIGALPMNAAARVPGMINGPVGEPVLARDCSETAVPPDPPRIRVSGAVHVPPADFAPVGSEPSPLKNASYAVKGLIRGSTDSNAPLQRRTINAGPGNSGPEVTGNLDELGRFTLDFTYPAPTYVLSDWTTYYGCEAIPPFRPFQMWTACADGDLQLEIYADSTDGIRVNGQDGQKAVLATIDLGLFFQREDNQTHMVDNEPAHAYVGVYNVFDLVDGLPEGQRFDGVTVNLHATEPGSGYGYNHATGSIDANRFSVEHSEIELFAGHRYYHQLLGVASPGVPENCRYDQFADHTSDECAFQLGFAGAIANAAEVTHDENLLTVGLAGYNIEECTKELFGPIQACEEGDDVPGRVAAGMRDVLDDSSRNETTNGFTDTAHEELGKLTSLIYTTKPATIMDFTGDWRATYGGTIKMAMFMNTLVYYDLQDDTENARLQGERWDRVACSQCRGGSQLVNSGSGVGPNLLWDLRRNITAPSPVEILVRLTPDPFNEYEAQYVVTTGAGGAVFTLDQARVNDGWYSLSSAGVGVFDPAMPDSGTLSLRRANNNSIRTLIADAVIVAPSEAEVVDLPRVTISGRVENRKPISQETSKPLKGAHFVAKWRDANLDWHDLRRGPGNTGDVVEGYLGQNGEFTLEDIIYPTHYTLPDGTRWTGCTPGGTPLNASHFACSPHDFILEVHAENEDGSIVVRMSESRSDVAIAATVELGEFFLKPSGHTYQNKHYEHAAFPYVSAQNVADVLAGAPEGLGLGDIEMYLGGDGSGTEYVAGEAKVRVDPRTADASNTEVAVSAAYLDRLHGIFSSPGLPEGCNYMRFDEEAGKECGFNMGFPLFLAALAERNVEFDAPTLLLKNFDGGTHDIPPSEYSKYLRIDSCAASNAECKSGSGVPGRVAGWLWDLTDPAGERVDPLDETEMAGFDDEVANTSIFAIAATIADTTPDSFEEFFGTWKQRDNGAYIEADTNLAFLNTLLYSGLFDNPDASGAQGTWTIESCGELNERNRRCMNGSFLKSGPNRAGADDLMKWDVSSAMVNGVAKYDIYVHIPDIVPVQERDSSAVYRHGAEGSPVDQSASTGWVLLNKHGSEISANNEVLLTRTVVGTTGDHLSADAILIVPHGSS
ncbi:hypothetical protein [Actinokineospora sp. HUAS TT18]|uniref:hypothetical protein n=1 Tax=Actinokineospora sp. HUAS TT18 TaxID=3447451 RepID=UPI003F51FB88